MRFPSPSRGGKGGIEHSPPSRGGQGRGWVTQVKGQTNANILRRKLQRQLRHKPTDAERKLWSVLRARQMAGYKFRRQHPFGDYILDFVCLEARLVIEVDGGQHATPVISSKDLRRTQ